MTLKHAVLTSLALLAASQAFAQTPTIRRALPGGYGAELQSGEILVQAQRSLNIAIERSEDARARQDDAVRMIYRMAERECDLLLETIAETCELAGVTANASFNDQNRAPTITASGSFSMKIRLKTPGAPSRRE